MLRISSILINHCRGNCITDEKPNIRFSLESDIAGEALDYAVITCGDWSIETTDQLNNIYGGEMQPFATYTVHIHATGLSGESAEAEAAFSTGRLDMPWAGKWITDETYSFPQGTSPVPMVFRKQFPVQKPLRRAWINSTALGIYELNLNGQKVGQDYFAPGFTSYVHQIQYQTYDLMELLQEQNLLSITVAGGWAAGTFTMKRKSHISCDRQAFLGEIHLEYEDGTSEVIGTDESWQVTEDSPYKLAEWYDGETFDATFEESCANWRNASVTEPRDEPKLLAQYGQPVRVGKILVPISCTKAASGELIYDFGQNFSGVICAKIKNAACGQTVIVRHAEVLVDGELFVKPLRTAKATAIYICKNGEQTYSPHFTYMGFRYAGVSGIDPEDLELTALVLHSELERTGEFICSNELLNKLNENIRWGGLSNFVDIPTDCPQRDERMGWTGDAAVFASTACYNFDMSRFYDKWLRDQSAEQGPGGGFPMVIPQQGDEWTVCATSCWGDSCILVPWAEYLARGDLELLKRQYPTMKRFLKAVKGWANLLSLGHSRYIWGYPPFHFGDWCAPGGDFMFWVMRAKWVGTSYFANSCGIMAKIAALLGENQDAAYYEKLRKKIILAHRKKLTDGKGKLKNEFQTAYTLPLHFGMTEGKETEAMADNLAALLKKNNYKVGTGFPGTPYLLFALSDHNHLEDAYRVLLQEECPGWLYAVKAGATTMWERWDALKPDGTVNMGTGGDDGGMVSFNHYANGAVGDWMYRRVAGIEPIEGGYRKFCIAPMPGGGLTNAYGCIMSPYGKISSRWEITDDIFTITVEVPVSTTCWLNLPNKEIYELSSGIHQFRCEF